MKDMISRIIEMDKTARELTQRAQRDKINSEQEIELKKEEIRNEYLERARKRIALNKITEQKLAQEQKQQIMKKFEKVSKSFDRVYAKKCDEWVNTIVENVLGE